MSAFLSRGGGRAYNFDIDIGLVKSPSPPCRSSSSSPTSTLSDSTATISNKKPRTPRKRPNQSYTEAVALLAKIHPNIFSAKNLMKHCKITKLHDDPFRDSSELLPPFPGLSDAGLLPRNNAQEKAAAAAAVIIPEKPKFSISKKKSYYCSSSSWNQSTGEVDDCDLDTESMLDEEVGEGIDSIMGIPMCEGETTRDYSALVNPYLGHLGGRYQMNMTRALRSVGNGDWWRSSPTIEMRNIVPSLKSEPVPEKKTKKNKNNKVDSSTSSTSTSPSTVSANLMKPALSLKLNYECVMKEWTGRGSLFSEASDSSESPMDIIGKLSDMDLFSEVAGSGTMREASVLRYKEKRRSRLFSKQIRYQVRKMNADRRPRMKGRFVKEEGED